MPRNKRESFIYSVIMCFTMVLWMSMYNVTLHMGHLSLETIREGWIGFPFAFVYAFLFDWFIVSGPAKGIAFRYFVSPESSTLRKVITISCCMVVPMVFVMSLYGGLEACVKSGAWSQLLIIWLTNIPKNIIMALPFQLIVAGPLVRRVFRTAFYFTRITCPIRFLRTACSFALSRASSARMNAKVLSSPCSFSIVRRYSSWYFVLGCITTKSLPLSKYSHAHASV